VDGRLGKFKVGVMETNITFLGGLGKATQNLLHGKITYVARVC
jgi:hypothetical protein